MTEYKNVAVYVALVVAAVLLISVLLGFGEPKEKSAIKIGVLAPLSGVVAQVGEDIRSGVNATAFDGVEFIFEDDKCEPAAAVSAFKKLTEVDKVNFIIGPACGSPQEAITPLLKDSDVLVLVPAAASDALYEGSGGNFYNIQYSLEDEARFLAKTLDTRGLKHVAVISYNNAFSKVLHDSFLRSFSGVVVKDLVVQTEDADISTELAKLKGQNFDAIFSTDVLFLFATGPKKLSDLGITAPIYSPYPVEIPSIMPLGEGILHSFPGDIDDSKGVVHGLSKSAVEFLLPLVQACDGAYACVKERFDSSGAFNATGTSVREIILKDIINGKPVVVE